MCYDLRSRCFQQHAEDVIRKPLVRERYLKKKKKNRIGWIFYLYRGVVVLLGKNTHSVVAMDAWWVGDGDERIGGAEQGAESGAYYHGIRRRHHIGFRLQYGDPFHFGTWWADSTVVAAVAVGGSLPALLLLSSRLLLRDNKCFFWKLTMEINVWESSTYIGVYPCATAVKHTYWYQLTMNHDYDGPLIYGYHDRYSGYSIS